MKKPKMNNSNNVKNNAKDISEPSKYPYPAYFDPKDEKDEKMDVSDKDSKDKSDSVLITDINAKQYSIDVLLSDTQIEEDSDQEYDDEPIVELTLGRMQRELLKKLSPSVPLKSSYHIRLTLIATLTYT